MGVSIENNGVNLVQNFHREQDTCAPTMYEIGTVSPHANYLKLVLPNIKINSKTHANN